MAANKSIDAGPRTKAPVETAPAKIRDLQLPEFVAMPSGKGSEFHSGLKRGALNQLVLPCEVNGYRPPVKSITMRRPGSAKGKRLIVLASLLAYLRKLQREQESEHSGARTSSAKPSAKKGAGSR